MAKILLIIAQEGYQVKEYDDTKKVLEDAGHIVITAAKEAGEATSHIASKTKVNLAISQINIDDYDAFYFIGGAGAVVYLDNEEVYSLIKNISENTLKPFGAICISPRILIKSGVMKGIHMTGWNEDNDLRRTCEEAGAIYIRERVVRDGRIITADGPMSAYEFGEAIAAQFDQSANTLD